jgi:hypothetical protein
VRTRVGAAFSLVMYRAAALLQMLQRLALQVLEALKRLARRTRTAPAEADTADVDEAGEDATKEEAAGEVSELGERRGSRARRRGFRTPRRKG